MGDAADKHLDVVMGRVLQAGVILASAVIFIGAVIYLLRHGAEMPLYRTFHPVAPELRQPGQLTDAARKGSGRALIQVGVLLMIATPVLRVAVAAYLFAREGDRLYVLISVIVLSILMCALMANTAV